MENKNSCSSSDQKEYGSNSLMVLWGSAIPLITLFVITIIANGAVVVMVAINKTLQKCRNVYIASLAVADFILGCTLPLSVLETLNGGWMFSEESCWIFLIFRYSLFFVTVLSIVLITFDRWWSINYPISYRVRKSKKMAAILVISTWLVSFVVHIPLLFSWRAFKVVLHDNPSSKFCMLPFNANIGLTVGTFVFEYITPFITLLVLNCGIYFRLLKRRNSKILRRSLSMSDTYSLTHRKYSTESSDCVSSATNNSDELIDFLSNSLCRSEGRRNSATVFKSRRFASVPPFATKQTVCQVAKILSGRRVSMDVALLSGTTKPRKSSLSSIVSRTRKQSDDIVRDFLVRQEKKAFLSLGLLVVFFFVCWTPESMCNILFSVCANSIPPWLLHLTSWIQSTSAAINPFLYCIGSSDFRRVSKTWFSCSVRDRFKLQEALLFYQVQQTLEMAVLKEVENSNSI
ncbi:hypothetical protein ACJMK2_010156 [Sinanodonta woodiana]|uniref:G-protein coupled receptors family 1 profile domain-containing protein n=1 Tax=Sinanodonta woodiana TaxID=1069815 RepID=A0ABD3VEG0_SINWO